LTGKDTAPRMVRAEHRHHQHGGAVERWAHLDEPDRDEWQRPGLVVAAARLADGQVVADIGAGTGYFEVHLSRAVGARGRVLALDVNPKLVEHMKRRFHDAGLNNVEAWVLQHEDPGLEPGSLDRVLVIDLWHHLHDRVAYGRRLRAALRPEGRLLVIDRDADSSHAPPVEMRISVETVIGELEAAGFSARVLPQTLPRQFMVEGTVRSATPPE
jgi:SAM-dependent methyltransferase